MQQFDRLFGIVRTLRGENGCPWDKEQTLKSMVSDLVEETYESVEAIENNDPKDIEEELGDLLFLGLFLSYLAEQEGIASVGKILDGVSDKLVRRHPHVFGGENEKNVDQILVNWEAIKKTEAKKSERKTPFDGIPKGMPDIQKYFKVLEKIRRTGKVIPLVDKKQWLNSFQKIMESGSEKEFDEFLEALMVYSFHRKLDLSSKIRSLTRKQIEGFLSENEEKK